MINALFRMQCLLHVRLISVKGIIVLQVIVQLRSLVLLGFAKASNWAVFYQQIRHTLVYSRLELLTPQPGFRPETFDHEIQPKSMPCDLPSRDLLETSMIRYFEEVNPGTCVLDYAHFQNSIEDVYQNKKPPTQAFLRIINLVLALAQNSKDWFEKADGFTSGTLREGTLQSVQAFMLSV